MKTETITTKAGHFYVEGDILYSFLEGDIDLESALDHVGKMAENFAHLLPMKILADFSKLKSVNKEARQFFSETEVAGINAMVISNPIHKIITNLFMNYDNPLFPNKVFTDREEAKKWLDEQSIAK